MSVLLMRPERDAWSPGEHNGTFRGNGLAFTTAVEAIRLWNASQESVQANCRLLGDWCERMTAEVPRALSARGVGMMRGLEFHDPGQAGEIARRAIDRGVLVEPCGPRDEVLKIMAPLNIQRDLLQEGLDRIAACVRDTRPRNTIFRHAFSKRDQPSLDRHDDGGNPVSGAELAHGIA